MQTHTKITLKYDIIFPACGCDSKTKTTKIVRPFNPQRLSYSPTANGCGTPKVFNAAISCTNNKCQVKCMNKYAFPSGDTQLMVNCEDGEWVFDRAEWTEIPPCKRKRTVL